MKKIIILTLFTFILFPNKSILAQIDTTSLSLYPLHTGNYWEYSEIICESPFDCDTTYFSLEVIGNTLLPNDKLYKIIVKKSIPDSNNFREYIYERVDSVTANVYRYYDNWGLKNNEYLIDSLKSEVGDTSKASRDDPWFAANASTICWAAHIDSVLGVQLFIKDFYNRTYLSAPYYRLGQNIGLIRYDYYGETYSVHIILKYAIINGKKFGQKISTSVHHEDLKPLNFFLYQNYPNPFNSSTVITYKLLKSLDIELSLYNIIGQKLRILYRGFAPQGKHSFIINAQYLPSGMYIYELRSGQFNYRRACMILK
ncbi:T9SS type A sorting domain-containing protein [candidate division KSB1 bacterium]|nr:T9SS type A sorting domain-containing protein [candidate division KSB1 bacterium]